MDSKYRRIRPGQRRRRESKKGPGQADIRGTSPMKEVHSTRNNTHEGSEMNQLGAMCAGHRLCWAREWGNGHVLRGVGDWGM